MVTDELLTQHGLSEGEYKKIVDVLKREPNFESNLVVNVF